MANKVLSIYVGNEAIRIAEMQMNNSKTKSVILCNAAEVKTPDNCVNDGYLVDVTAIAEAIRSSIFGRGFTAKEVIFTISSKKIASKDVEVPFMKNEAKLKDILYANSNEYFPMSNQTDYCFAFSKLEDFQDEEGRKSRVSAIAAPNDLVKNYYELAEELKLSVNSIDFFGNSIIQLLSVQMQDNEVDMVLQIEKDSTYVNIMRGKTLILQRSVPYGKNAVVNALMDVKKISEKDANTLLSNETLLDQHVSADEYAATVQYLVNGIARVVEYHRTKNKNDALQGIKVFGEGSAIAGIDKILQRELGAPVQRFESLSGVSVRGQACLTPEQVLRYLPNIGAVIRPMNLKVEEGRERSRVSSEQTFKFLVVLLIIAIVGMGSWAGYTYYKYSEQLDKQAEIQAQIDAISDIEQIAIDYEEAKGTLDILRDFEASTNNNNEYILQFFTDIESLIPTGTSINDVVLDNGYVEFTLTSAWHLTTKNEMADVFVHFGALDYVRDFHIVDYSEEYMTLFVTGYDEEGNAIYLREEAVDETELPELIMWEEGEQYPDEYADYPLEQLVQVTYNCSCFFGPDPSIVVEEEEDELALPSAPGTEESTETTEEGGEE